MNKEKIAKIWLYFRTGYSYYFVFLVSGLNALMIAYFVVILGTTCAEGVSLEESGDVLCILRWMFPHFGWFVLFCVGVGLPTLALIGYWHYKKNQYGTHAYIEWETNPYLYKLTGHQKIQFEVLKEIIHELKIESLGEKHERLKNLETKIDILITGGSTHDIEKEKEIR